MREFLRDFMKDELLWGVDRSSPADQIRDFVERSDGMRAEIRYQEKIDASPIAHVRTQAAVRERERVNASVYVCMYVCILVTVLYGEKLITTGLPGAARQRNECALSLLAGHVCHQHHHAGHVVRPRSSHPGTERERERQRPSGADGGNA
jgi:hypothetical protein